VHPVEVRTRETKEEFLEITAGFQEAPGGGRRSPLGFGLLYVPHTTAGITIQRGTLIRTVVARHAAIATTAGSTYCPGIPAWAKGIALAREKRR